MASVNKKVPSVFTHEGGKAKRITPEMELRRSVMTCLLWENEFYEDGKTIANRISSLVERVRPADVMNIAIEAREKQKLRHVPLLIAREMLNYPEHKQLVKLTLSKIIQRPDELTEFLALYWEKGKRPLAKQVQKGLAEAFTKFNAYQLSKWNKDNAIKLRDVAFLVHPKPKDDEQGKVWAKFLNKTFFPEATKSGFPVKEKYEEGKKFEKLEKADTWESNLVAGKDKKETFTRLTSEKKLGAMAVLRNLRNMEQSGVDENKIRQSIKSMNPERVLPFRFITAAKYAPRFEPELEEAMFKCLALKEKLPGRTVLLVDVSGSMEAPLSSHGGYLRAKSSETSRLDVAYGLAMLLREICTTVDIYTFSNSLVLVPPRRGFGLKDAINNSQDHGATYLGSSVRHIDQNVKYDRLIVITDEQSHDNVPDPKGKGIMINVASNKRGVGYGKWLRIDGWSEAVIDYVTQMEDQGLL